jgi:hypothetical protein
MGGNYGGRQHRCRCAGVRTGAISRMDRPTLRCRGHVRNDQRRGIHCRSACFNIDRVSLEECFPVSCAQVLNGIHASRGSASEDVRFAYDVWQIFLAGNPQHNIPHRCGKRRAGAGPNDVGVLLNISAATQICTRERDKERNKCALHARCSTRFGSRAAKQKSPLDQSCRPPRMLVEPHCPNCQRIL